MAVFYLNALAAVRDVSMELRLVLSTSGYLIGRRGAASSSFSIRIKENAAPSIGARCRLSPAENIGVEGKMHVRNRQARCCHLTFCRDGNSAKRFAAILP